MLSHVKESMQMVESSLMEKEQVRTLGVVQCWEWCSVGSGVVLGVV